MGNWQFDDRDQQIVNERAQGLDAHEGVRVGDYVDFADGVTRRVSYLWPGDCYEDGQPRAQTSDGGSWYLGNGYVSFSGSLYECVSVGTMRETGQKAGAVWVFHHDYWGAHRGVSHEIPFRVFECAEKAPQY